MEAQEYTRKPSQVTAMKFEGSEEELFQVVDWINTNFGVSADTEKYTHAIFDQSSYRIALVSFSSSMQTTDYVHQGQWVVRSSTGEFFVRSNEEFETNYELNQQP